MASILKFPRRRAGRANRPAACNFDYDSPPLDFMQAARRCELEDGEEPTNVIALEAYRSSMRLGR